MNPLNPKKLQHSKWTAHNPTDNEKHFLVTEVQSDDAGFPETCVLESVYSRREVVLAWRDLANSGRWKIGWH